MDTRDDTNISSSGGESSQLLYLSLFLLLLAFFILLNSMATIEETRSREVPSSVAAAFRAVEAPDEGSRIVIAELGPVADPERMLEAMKLLLFETIGARKLEIQASGGVLQVTMQANELFLGGEATLRRDRLPLLENMANLLSARAGGFAHEMELVHGGGGMAGALPARRAAALANSLVSLGAPDDVVSVGVREGHSKSLRMRFMFRPENEAFLTFRELLR